MTAFRVALTFDAEHPDRRPGGVTEDPGRSSRGSPARHLLPAGPLGLGVSGHRPADRGRGHLVGSHSHSTRRWTHLTDVGLAEDIAEAEPSIRTAPGRSAAVVPVPVRRRRDDARVLRALDRRRLSACRLGCRRRRLGDRSRPARRIEADVLTGVIRPTAETWSCCSTLAGATGRRPAGDHRSPS